ncbi:MAG: Rpn family recombination-promoting nuclease/putative transposase [Candidatus Latescibacterota bacterium]
MSTAKLPFPPREFADRGTKWLLGHPAHLRHLLRILLGPDCDRIDYDRLEPVPTELLSEDLRQQLADLVFVAPFRQPQHGEVTIFVLVEHQTSVSPAIRFRVLSYMVQLWDRQRQQWERQRQPQSTRRFHAILPVVFYTGTRSWDAPPCLDQLVSAPGVLRRFVPQVELLFLPLHQVPPEHVLVEETAFGHLLRVMQESDSPAAEFQEHVHQAAGRIGELTTGDRDEWSRLLYFLLLFLWHCRDPEEYPVLEQLVRAQQQDRVRREEIETMGKTIVQHFIEEGEARGRAQGREEGREEGRAEGRQQVLLKLLRAKFGDLPPALEERLGALTADDLDDLAVRLLNARSLAELGL